MIHAPFIRRCLELAVHGRHHVGNGALVGAVLVRNENTIAEGHHEEFGKPHAERSLLENFDQKISSEDVLYVNLEPCSHHGKTPPCTDIIIERGIKYVVFGMIDPDPRVSGKGISALERAGIKCVGPIVRTECEWLNRGFISVRTKQRPWITLKRAQMKDGRVANPDGSPLKITSDLQNQWSHTWLRAGLDAILVGVGTIIRDNPQLNTRLDQNNRQRKGLELYRIILDPSLKIPLDAHVVTDEQCDRTIIITDSVLMRADQQGKYERLQDIGVRVFPLARDGKLFVWDELWKALLTPREDYHGITSILVEGGPKTWKIFEEAGMVDEKIILVGSC